MVAKPYFITIPATSLIAALGSTGLALGTAGIVGGATLGVAWGIVLGVVVERLIRRAHRKRLLANGFVFLGTILLAVVFVVFTLTAFVPHPPRRPSTCDQ